MTRTRAVLFDFGGTLAVVGLEQIARAAVRRFADAHGVTCAPETLFAMLEAAAAQANRSVAARPFYLFRDAFQEGFRLTFARLGVTLSPADTAEMHAFLREQIVNAPVQVVDGARETLAALRGRRLRLGIVSNMDQEELAALLGSSGLGDAVDFALSSEAARSCKPDPRIFREALRRAGCAAGEALFVGDSPDHDIIGANRAGMRTVLYVRPRPASSPLSQSHEPAGDARPHHVIGALSGLLPLVDA